MSKTKIAVTIDRKLLTRLDRFVRQRRLPSRSRAVKEVLKEKLDRLDRSRLARECAKLDPVEERQQAEEGFAQDMEHWPAY